MPKSKGYQSYLVLVAIALSVIFAFIPTIDAAMASIALAFVGIVIGFTNITVKEVDSYLIVALTIGLLFAALWAIFPASASTTMPWLRMIFANIATVIIPSAVVVGLVRWYKIGQP